MLTPLAFVLQSSSDGRSPRQSRQLAYVSEFTTDIRYIEGQPIMLQLHFRVTYKPSISLQ